MLKAFADFQATSKLSFNLSMNAFSSSFARGNENNQHDADGVYYMGPGKSGGYSVVNFGFRYLVLRRLELFARVNNLLDRKYYSAAQLGPTGFMESGSFIARPLPAIEGEFPVRQSTFYAPGARRIVWGGIRLGF
jgi:outer membrane receptor protein involved in Fe transport